MNNELKKPISTILLLMINAAVFLGLSMFGMTEDAGFMLEHGAMYVPFLQEEQEYYRMVTSIFLHFGIAHLMNNMIMLAVLGTNLEREIGSIKFMILYLAAGIGGNICSMWYDIATDQFVVSAGASGAVFGIIGALLYVVIRHKGRLGTLTGRGILFMIALSLYYGFSNKGIDNLAHLGGLGTGFLAAVLLYRKPNHKGSALA